MKTVSLVVALALGLPVLGRQAPANDHHEIAARQRGGGGGGFGGGWGGGGGGGWGGGGWGGGGSGTGSGTCSWTDHCLGDECETENDCDGQLICRNGVCASTGAAPATTLRTTARPTTVVRTTARPTATAAVPSTCGWPGHCAGDVCTAETDCDGYLGCVSGKCADVGYTSGGAGAVPVPTSTRRPGVTSTRAPPGPIVTVTVTRSTPVPVQPTPTTRPATGGGGASPACGADPLSCIGVSCKTDADCGYSLIICNNGICGL
ncbi:hypothetical protein B0H66DRAFT_591961 [Apodospora peruviana]|uniref:Uncharacterized protein n=1 Tax=Apodospora peruviana TaxID=516989 RepID=A0AAE0I6C1_9PEZI|nr:hypothetical protein B0H66DRAFT_591961 [Apodospora peruviana]